MQLKQSELAIENLLIIASKILTIPTTEEFKFPNKENLDLNIDYRILTNSKNKSKFKILISIEGNNTKNPKPGYSFSLAAEGVFKLNDIENMGLHQINHYISISALPMLISHIRSYMISVTAYYPYGKYILPSINLSELIKDKNDQIEKDKKKTIKKK